jgi:excisionase family DNA binding protein
VLSVELVGLVATEEVDDDVAHVGIVERGSMTPPRRSPYVGDRLLTVGEVASLMRVSTMTVYRLIKSGSLAAIRVGKNYRIRESDVNRYLSDRAVKVEIPNG